MKTIVGQWNLSDIPYNLGNTLLFCYNMVLLKKASHAEKIHLQVCGEDRNEYECIVNIAKDLVDIDTIIFSSVPLISYDFPPSDYDYKSYRFLSDMSPDFRRSVPLLLSEKSLKRGTEFFDSLHGKKFLTFHLKYNSSNKKSSNARLDVWAKALSQIATIYPDVVLLIVGSDQYPQDFENECRQIRNLMFTRDHLLKFSEEFFLIQKSTAFLGMASGPSNVAIISSRPYLVFKHAEDVREENFDMNEMEGDHLKGSDKDQLFLIEEESCEVILQFVKNLNA